MENKLVITSVANYEGSIECTPVINGVKIKAHNAGTNALTLAFANGLVGTVDSNAIPYAIDVVKISDETSLLIDKIVLQSKEIVIDSGRAYAQFNNIITSQMLRSETTYLAQTTVMFKLLTKSGNVLAKVTVATPQIKAENTLFFSWMLTLEPVAGNTNTAASEGV